jgi:hypothetical protein
VVFSQKNMLKKKFSSLRLERMPEAGADGRIFSPKLERMAEFPALSWSGWQNFQP